MRRDLEGGVAVVTGASSGIGRAAAHEFASRGAHVVAASRTVADLARVKEECECLGPVALAIPTDVTDEAAVARLARQVVEKFGHIDVWVNSAAVILYGNLSDVPLDVFRRVIETNLFGTIYGSRAALIQFHRQGSGTLINIDSLWGRLISPHVGAYVTSKFAIRGLSGSLRENVSGNRDMNVVTILPQSVDTPIFRHAANYTGREIRPVPPVIAPERVARAIVRAAERPHKREVVVGITGKVGAVLHDFLPWVYHRTVHQIFDRLALGTEGRPSTHGNLFEPMAELNRIKGGWRSRRPVAAGLAVAAGAAIVPWAIKRRRC